MASPKATASPAASPAAAASPTGTAKPPPRQPASHTPARTACLVCHEQGIAGAPKFPANHAGRTDQMCPVCHTAPA
ncbi:MAG: hypothetical protein HYY29_06005 [Chloroflexi bacterium]|nr:hypothetical protein [Chloroflexota bacterium]